MRPPLKRAVLPSVIGKRGSRRRPAALSTGADQAVGTPAAEMWSVPGHAAGRMRGGLRPETQVSFCKTVAPNAPMVPGLWALQVLTRSEHVTWAMEALNLSPIAGCLAQVHSCLSLRLPAVQSRVDTGPLSIPSCLNVLGFQACFLWPCLRYSYDHHFLWLPDSKPVLLAPDVGRMGWRLQLPTPRG